MLVYSVRIESSTYPIKSFPFGISEAYFGTAWTAERVVKDLAEMSASIQEGQHLPELIWLPHSALLFDVGNSIDTLPFEVAESSEALCDRLQLILVDLLALDTLITTISDGKVLDQRSTMRRDVLDKLSCCGKLDNDKGGHSVESRSKFSVNELAGFGQCTCISRKVHALIARGDTFVGIHLEAADPT